MHVLITGGAGFIGSHLVEYHLSRSDIVHVIDDLSTGNEENVKMFQDNPNYYFTQSDLLTYPELEREVYWADRIYHMAAVVGVFKVIHDSESLLSTNIAATERLLRAAKKSVKKPRILLASTSEVYGEGHSRALNEDLDLIIGKKRKNCSAYAVSKIAVEYFGMSYFDNHGIPITILRIFNTVGPRQLSRYGMVVPRFIKSALHNEPIEVYGNGEQTRSFVDVRDVAALIDTIGNTEKTIGETINVGQDQEVSINDLAKMVKKIAKSQSEIKHISYDEAYGTGFEDIMFRRPDTSKLLDLTHYNYQWTLEKTIKDLVERGQSK